MIAIEKEGIRRVVVLVSRFTREPVALTDLDEHMDAVMRRNVEKGDYCVVYDGPPNWGKAVLT